MDYTLENVRTGETYDLDPNRTLIGNADHANIRTGDGGPFLAALIVKYDSGWSIHGLSDSDVTLNGNPLRVAQQFTPQSGDILEVVDERFQFTVDTDSADEFEPLEEARPLASCFAYIRFPDGMEECRVVDHNLLFGRLRMCHVRFADTKLSRLNALFAPHGGTWYVHALNKGVIGRNRRAVSGFAILQDEDMLQIGPLMVRIEMRRPSVSSSAATKNHFDLDHETVGITDERLQGRGGSGATDAPTVETTLQSTADNGQDPPAGTATIYVAGVRLDQWLKAHAPDGSSSGSQPGISTWFGAQKERLKRFWLDTPETTSARVLRTSGRMDEAFAVLDRAIRARPESPDLLRELYRLYESLGFLDLGFRPLRVIEKLANARGGTDTWVLETLAKLCERLGKQRPPMFDRAINYWTKLERATGVNYAREKAATMASRTLCASGFSKRTGDDD